MLSNQLNDIYLNFYPMECNIISLVRNIMNYFKYEIQDEWYYVMGHGTQLGFPFLMNEVHYFKECFKLLGELCYFSGAWNTDYITQDKDGFFKALKYKWLEWDELKQKMPFVIGRVLKANGKVEFYILNNFDVISGEFILISNKGNRHYITCNNFISDSIWLGFSTIDVPNNFLVKSKLYRNPYKAGEYCLVKTAINLLNKEYMLSYLKQVAEESEKSIVENLFLKISSHCKKQEINSDLNRFGFSLFLIRHGFPELANRYNALGNDWNGLFELYNKSNKIDIKRMKSIAKKELDSIYYLSSCELIIR